MRAFVVLCLVAAACADKLGYNYRPVGHSDFGLSFTPGGSVGHASGGSSGGVGHQGNGGLVNSGFGFGGQVGGFGVGVNSFNAGLGVGNSAVAGSGHGSFNGGASYAPQAELQKEFYTYTANEDDFSVPHVENQLASSGKKSLRVIFIKGPEQNGVENAAIALAKHIAEQKTAIYVLQKQPDLSSLSNKLNTINSNVNHKPEVHFVKYRTHEDAVNAQKAIQEQYDSLGGVSNNFNGGEAPVLNFASKTPATSHGTQGSFGPAGSAGSSGSFVPSGSVGSSGSFGTTGSVVSSGSVELSGSHGSFHPSGSLSSVGSHGSSGTFESSGTVGSSELSSASNSYVPPQAPSSSYLPA